MISNSSIAIVVVNYRTPELAVRCVSSLMSERADLPGLHVVVVDGGSGDGSADRLQQMLGQEQFKDWVELLPLPMNGGFGWANNQAILRLLHRQEPPEFIHLLNPDTEVEAGAVSRLLECLLARPDAAAAGSQLLEPDGSPTGSAFSFPSIAGEVARGARTGLITRLLGAPDPALQPCEHVCEADWVTGASVLLRTSALLKTGLFDDGFFLYHEEVELMWRLRRDGWSIWHEPASRVKHVGGASTGVHSRPPETRLAPRRPAYWYQSRRRWFALARGRSVALAAGLGWLAGHVAWCVRSALSLTRAQDRIDHELRDHLLHFVLPRRHDRLRAVPDVKAQPGTPPAWSRWSR